MSSRKLGLAFLIVAIAVNEWTVAGFLGLQTGVGLPAVRASIWAFQLLAASAGLWLLLARRTIHKGYLIIIPMCVFMLLAGAEVIAGMALTRGRSPLRKVSTTRGWETAPDIRLSYTNPAFGAVSLRTGPFGFRRWDRSDSTDFRVLVLGDSYTEAIQVSDGETWFDQIARADSTLRIFAYGTGGYGSVQEYMVLDQHFDSIKPDLIIWQLSANDLINNDHFLETQSPIGTRMARPFYENGKVVVRFAGSGGAVKYSRLVRFINARIAMLQGHGFAPASLERERQNHPQALERSIRTTRAVMTLANQRAAGIPIVAFVSEGDAYADSVLQATAVASGWTFIPGVRDSIDAARTGGMRVDGMPRDGHWNANGHAIAGRVIARHLGSSGILWKHHRGDDGGSENAGDHQQRDLNRNVIDRAQ